MSRLLMLLTAFGFGISFSVHAGEPHATQKSVQGGVTVAVTPGNIGVDAKVWDFAVVLDTHSQELSDDVAKSALLVDPQGNEFAPVDWDGEAPGGHHRAGVLKFNAIAPRPQSLELRLKRPGEGKPRSFRWTLD